jgi:hypothetical protein
MRVVLSNRARRWFIEGTEELRCRSNGVDCKREQEKNERGSIRDVGVRLLMWVLMG